MTDPVPIADAIRLESERLKRTPRTAPAGSLPELLTQLIAALHRAFITPPDDPGAA